MPPVDPIKKLEGMIQEIHDTLGKHTQPVLKRYPLTFTFLLVFGVAAVLHGFELVTDHIPFFENHPWSLVLCGVVVLLITGSLYKSLSRQS